MQMIWSDDQIEFMKRLMEDSLSTARIAEEIRRRFHVTCTRNAVIGKIHRLDLKAKKRPANCVKPKAVIVPRDRRYRYRPSQSPIRIENVSLHPVSILDIEDDACRWIVIDPNIMCGDPVVHGSPYCPHHKGIGTQLPYRKPPLGI